VNTYDDDPPLQANPYAQKVFELEKDTGEFHETCFDEMKTDYLLKDIEEEKELDNEIIGYTKMQQQKFNMLINKQDTEEAKVPKPM
jgi:hypothetical protein